MNVQVHYSASHTVLMTSTVLHLYRSLLNLSPKKHVLQLDRAVHFLDQCSINKENGQ